MVEERASYGQRMQTNGRVSRHARRVGDGGLYERLFESVGVGVAFVGPEDGIVLRCNPAYASILGSTPEEVEGRSFFGFLSEEQGAKARRERELRLRGGSSDYEVTVAADAGEERHLLATGVPLYDERDGSYLGAAQTLVDVTERRRAEEAVRESERLQRFAFEEAPVGMALLDPDDGRWLAANRALCGFLGYFREQLLAGMAWQDVTHPDDLEADSELARRVLAGEIGSYSVEKRYLRKGGRVVWARLTVSLMRGASDEPDLFFSIVEDITERRIAGELREPLTDRELEVLGRVAAGRSDPQVAEDLRYSLGTVKRDLRSVFCKLGVANRTEAAKRAVEIGLVAP